MPVGLFACALSRTHTHTISRQGQIAQQFRCATLLLLLLTRLDKRLPQLKHARTHTHIWADCLIMIIIVIVDSRFQFACSFVRRLCRRRRRRLAYHCIIKHQVKNKRLRRR